jgi:enoyl-[acyl-carrier protein] reductase I
MSHQLLKGKKGIIFGALDERSIAWKTALRVVEEGGEIILSNAPIALRMGKINELAKMCNNAPVIGADATSVADLENLMQKSMEHFALSLHKVLQTAMKTDALNEWSSVVALTYIAAQRTFPGYNDMAEAKALLESIGRSFGYHYGFARKVRVNTVSQSPTVTTAGSGVSGFDVFYDYADKMSPLGNAPAEDCANFCVALFSDMTKYVTMQNLFHDGGFSNTGVSQPIVEKMQAVAQVESAG